MVIYGVYIVSKSGGLIFNHDHNSPKIENEKTFSFPLDIRLKYENKKIIVEFGQRDGINVGHMLLAINGIPVTGRQLDDGRDAFEVIENKENYPVNLKFGRAKMTTNEKIFLASMFYPLFAIASQLSPEPKCSGIEILEADTFKLHCFQTLTGMCFKFVKIFGQFVDDGPLVQNRLNFAQKWVDTPQQNNRKCKLQKLQTTESAFIKVGVKMMVVAEPTQAGMDILLKRIYELYADYALKNPFYSLEMPIRCELFDTNLQTLLEQVEKSGISNV